MHIDHILSPYLQQHMKSRTITTTATIATATTGTTIAAIVPSKLNSDTDSEYRGATLVTMKLFIANVLFLSYKEMH